MTHKRLTLLFLVAMFTFAMVKSSPVQAQDTFCQYTISRTIRNTGGDPVIFWTGVQFNLDAIVNGAPAQPITYVGDAIMVAPGQTGTATVTVVSNQFPPGFFPFSVTPNTYESLAGPTVTSSNCTTDAPTIVQPGLQTGGLPYVIPIGTPTAEGSLPPLRLWDWDPTTQSGFVAINLTSEQMNNLPTNPAQNTEVAASPNGRIRFYVLTTGEFQVNSGPDFEGKVRVVVFNRQFQITNRYEFNVNG